MLYGLHFEDTKIDTVKIRRYGEDTVLFLGGEYESGAERGYEKKTVPCAPLLQRPTPVPTGSSSGLQGPPAERTRGYRQITHPLSS